MKNKGFTLVELLAVIAILAILVIIALPNVLKMYNQSKKNIFLTEVKSALNESTNKYISENMKGNKLNNINSLDETKLNLNNNKLKYEIKLDDNGKVLSYIISDSNYCIDSNKNINSITLDDINDGNCDNLNDLDRILGRDKLTNGVYFTDKILSDNKIYSDDKIDFMAKNYSSDKYSLNIGSEEISYSVKNITYYCGNDFKMDYETGKLTPINGSASDDLIQSFKSGNSIFCESRASCDEMYKISSIKPSGELSVIKITTIPNQRTNNGNGLYYNDDDGNKIYYFRGNVINNYLSVDGVLWRIVRFNDDYSIRIITNNGVFKSSFNNLYDDNAYVGYMYGKIKSNNYNDTHANINDSLIKTKLDDAFSQSSFSKYSSYLADSGFCADRSLASDSYPKFDSTAYGITDEENKVVDTGLGYGNNFTLYSSYYKYQQKIKPSFKCPNKNDLYTVSNNKGNKALKYPVGLLSIDEAIFAGAQYNSLNRNYYLYNENEPWWLMDAAVSYNDPNDPSGSLTFVASGSQGIYASDVRGVLSVRPVVSLKNNVIYKSGKGTYDDPYQIELR